jgi:hypothetical protein
MLFGLAVRRGRFSRWKAIHWVLLALSILGLAAVAGVGLVVALAASSLGSTKDLEDFASQAQARDFTSAHLPTPLPSSAVVEALHYERFTDWRITARVRLPSPQALNQYLEQAKQERKVDDAYCGAAEPSVGAGYFLPQLFACGSVQRGSSASILEIACNTR